jgi:8-oxo-dGTP pyrophosphatase MutT (NUDIX family)
VSTGDWLQDRLDALIVIARPIVDRVTINRDYEVPLVAGADADLAQTHIVYIDEDLPRTLEARTVDGRVAEFSPDKTLPWHEVSEWILMEEYGMPYDEGPDGGAHGVATQVENWFVRTHLSIDPTSYEAAYKPWIKEIGDERVVSVPPNLYRGPYKSPDEKKYLDELVAATAEKVMNKDATFAAPTGPTTGLQGYDLEGAAEAGKISKIEAEYNPGTVGSEPCRECKMFVRPDACTAVSGAINAEGHCKLFERGHAARKHDPAKMHGQTGRLTGFDGGEDDLENVAKAEAAPVQCAGVALVLPDGRALFLRRGTDQDHPGEWCFPGGKIEAGESPTEAAIRECREETGISIAESDIGFAVQVGQYDGFEYTTFVYRPTVVLAVEISDESMDFIWTDMHNPPTPLHPWVAAVIPVVASTGGATAATMAGKVAKSRDGQSDGDDKMTETMRLFVPIQKIDCAQRLVYGTAASEMPDHAQEIFDYDTSKPLFRAWSDGFAKTTGGKSLGNVRSMHNAKIAAGKVTSIDFNDATKTVDMAIKVVDDDEWRKVDEGVYTGISIGGKYAKRWRDGDHTRYTAQPSEVSLVDNPCIPNATFMAVKADGSKELRKFKGAEMTTEITNDLVAARATELAKAAGDASKWTNHLVEARSALEKEMKDGDFSSAQPKGGKKTPPHDGRQGFDGKNGDEETKIADEAKDKPGVTKPSRTKGDPDSKQPPVVSDKVKESNEDSSVSHKAAGAGDEDGDWKQAWVSKRLPGQAFERKSDLRTALRALDAEELAAKRSAPVMDALRGVTALLDGRDGGKTALVIEVKEDVIKNTDVVAKREYSDDERKKFAAEGIAKPDGSFPIPDKAALEDAKHAYGRSPTIGTKRHINRRAKALGEPGLGETKADKVHAPRGYEENLNKAATLQSVSHLIQLLGSIECCEEDFEIAPGKPMNNGCFAYAGTTVAVPKDLCDRFGTVIVDLGDIVSEVLDMLMSSIRGEERGEAAAPDSIMQQAAVATDLAKAFLLKVGAKHSAADKAKIKSAHDLLTDLDPDCCDGMNKDDDDDAGKSAIVADLEKRLAANDAAFEKTLGSIATMLGEVAARVERIEKTPLPGPHPAMFRLVEKGVGADAPAFAPFATGPESAYEMVPGVGRVRVVSGTPVAR